LLRLYSEASTIEKVKQLMKKETVCPVRRMPPPGQKPETIRFLLPEGVDEKTLYLARDLLV
jgi:hypothetical protein